MSGQFVAQPGVKGLASPYSSPKEEGNHAAVAPLRSCRLCALSGAAVACARRRQARAAFPDEPRHENRPDAAHGVARRAAEAGLRDASLRLCGHRRAEHARRLQRRRARLDPVQRADRPHHGHARLRLPRRPEGAANAARPARLDAGDEHAPRGPAHVSRPAHAVRARRHRRGQGRRREPARPVRLPREPRARPVARPRADALPLCAARRAALDRTSRRAGSSTRACSRRRASRRCSRRSGARSIARAPRR